MSVKGGLECGGRRKETENWLEGRRKIWWTGRRKALPSWVRVRPLNARPVLTFLAKWRNVNWGQKYFLANKINSRILFIIAGNGSDPAAKERVRFRRNASPGGKRLTGRTRQENGWTRRNSLNWPDIGDQATLAARR